MMRLQELCARVAVGWLLVGWGMGSWSQEPVRPPDLTLIDLRAGIDRSRVTTNDVEIEESRGDSPGLRVRTGTRAPWPGMALRAPEGGWDLSRFARIDVRLRNSGNTTVKVFGRVDNAESDGLKNCVTGDATLAPGTVGTLRVVLRRTSDGKLGGKLFGMRGYPATTGGEGTIDPTRVTQVLLFVAKPLTPHVFDVESVVAVGRYVPPTAWVTDADPYLPLIDRFGQYRHRDWPGKTQSEEDLVRRRTEEEKELARRSEPADWSKYGGWKGGPAQEATGYFRVTKQGGRWWLVDPEGYLFWSHGVDCVRMLDATPVEERESWFADYPGALPEFAEFVLPSRFALKGHYAGREPRCFSFAGANLKRKYGSSWREDYAAVIHRRLRSWGMNTIGNWSDAGVAQMRRTPYTDNLSSRGARMIEGSEGYWGKFPDPFDPRFLEGLRKEMEAKKGRSAGDAWCIGYFSDNELSWGDEVSLAEAALRSPPDQPAKRTLVADLSAKYREVSRLNRAWNTQYESWDTLLGAREVPDRELARADLEAFYTRLAEAYFEGVRKAIREVTPHQLYLGCRFAGTNPRAAAAAAKFCDVVSVNLYRRSVADYVLNGNDVPLLIGEFHFGALDRGMFHTGLVPVASQEARAEAYREYVEGALRNRQIVGTHWFQWQDEPTTGRVYDEENYQIGLVDIADTPYRETVEAVRAVGETMYTLRSGTTGGTKGEK